MAPTPKQRTRTVRFALAGAALLGSTVVSAGAATIQSHHAYILLSPAGSSAAAYMRIYNLGDDDRIDAVESGVAGRTALHVSEVDAEGVSRMRSLPSGLSLPAGGAVDLAPGGLHIMLLGIDSPPEPGTNVDLALHLASGDTVHLQVPVLAPGSAPESHHHDHQHGDHDHGSGHKHDH